MKKLDKNQKTLAIWESTKGFEQSEKASLGSIAKSATPPLPQIEPLPPVGSFEKSAISSIREARAKRYELLSTIRTIFIKEGFKRGLDLPTKYHRTSLCKHAVNGSEVGLNQGKNPKTEQKRGYFTGLQTCGSVWTCPICANRIQEQRRAEIAQAMKFFYGKQDHQKQAVMVTFTFPHNANDQLKELLTKFSKALKDFKSGSPWERFRKSNGFEGLIRSLEITRGANGWHPHTHELFFVNKTLDLIKYEYFIRQRWLMMCSNAGLLDITDEKKVEAFLAHSVDIKFNCKTSDYLAKFDDKSNWGIDREIAKASSKQGKKNGLHPFELASKGYSQLFIEYANAIKGKAQLFWSPKLKAKVGIFDTTDEEIAENEKESEEDKIIGYLSKADFTVVTARKLRAKILEMIEDEFDIFSIKEHIRQVNIKANLKDLGIYI